LAERLPGAKNYQITATERDGEVVFLHRLERGRASKSYGIQVARLAGLPVTVIERANDVLVRLERYEIDVFAEDDKQQSTSDSQSVDESTLKTLASRANRKRIAMQATLFDAINTGLIEEIRSLNVDTHTAQELIEAVRDIQNRIA
jgi:DNA mismatch repair protein MutS